MLQHSFGAADATAFFGEREVADVLEPVPETRGADVVLSQDWALVDGARKDVEIIEASMKEPCRERRVVISDPDCVGAVGSLKDPDGRDRWFKEDASLKRSPGSSAEGPLR